jgi:hypothetical protein
MYGRDGRQLRRNAEEQHEAAFAVKAIVEHDDRRTGEKRQQRLPRYEIVSLGRRRSSCERQSPQEQIEADEAKQSQIHD